MNESTNQFVLKAFLLKVTKTGETKAGKNYVEVVFSFTDNGYESFIPVTFWNKTAIAIVDIPIGSLVNIIGVLGGREWQDKYYGSNTGLKFKAEELQVSQAPVTLVEDYKPTADSSYASSEIPF